VRRWGRRYYAPRSLPHVRDEEWLEPDDLRDDVPGADEPEFALPQRRVPPANPTAWKNAVDQIAFEMREPGITWPANRQLHYVVSVPDTLLAPDLVLDVGCRSQKRDGEWRSLNTFQLSPGVVSQLPDPTDRHVLTLLSGVGMYGRTARPSFPYVRYEIPQPLLSVVLPLLAGDGRLTLRTTPSEKEVPTPLTWDDGAPWQFCLEVRATAPRNYEVTGHLQRGDERVDLAAPALLLGDLVFFSDRVARLDAGGALAWIKHLRRVEKLRVPASQADRFLLELLAMPRVPALELPPELAYETVRPAPRPRLRVRRAEGGWPHDQLDAEVTFDYDGVVVDASHPHHGVLEGQPRRLTLRALDVEAAARRRLTALGVRERSAYPPEGSQRLRLPARTLPRIARALIDEGWHVEADGTVYRSPGRLHFSVTSGIDWFELSGSIQFGDTVAHLPELLDAVRRGEAMVRLGDGTHGLLPEEWLARYAPLAGLGTLEGDHLRFRRTQVGLLDRLIAAQPETDVDALFARARDELRRFDSIAPADPPEGFTGRLRGYQREGLGWLHFLRQFGFGGCLADDMGLGKTVMVLALLEARRAEGRKKPSLVVVPRSLIFNWKAEAARFAPELSVLDHTGVGRRAGGEHFGDHDVILTTYGTLRRDVAALKDVELDYAILDEAQAIKNASTDAAKAARLLRADHRLALSGTPVENHLGELWSVFEFLNPGMLGTASALGLDAANGKSPDESTRTLLAGALRPFILRRTKAQVAPELPARTEQTVYCELEPLQRRLYDELRDHYRSALRGQIERVGLSRAKIMVLEALLRLRQAACHPGLIDRRRVAEPAGKLDVLLPRVREVLAEGHKALVFSQFTSFLAIVRRRLDAERIRYEYLDGQTRDREARVEHFQTDPSCGLFLVSLKAGGLGLNLTAAEHVFLLDPWWNPAVEAQAIDRAHRIGQTRHVLAFRLIARDTVEEKILALQAEKRELAEAIITERNSLIRTLTRDDLELLLS
jgi:superfamily II DNA or RNA helicase